MSNKFTFVILEPTYPEATEITKEDVWGKWSDDYSVQIHPGMIVASNGSKCPIWGDQLPYKSVTVVGARSLAEQISYWLEYVHGSDCIERVKDLDDDKIAIRSNYMAW